MNVRQGKFGRFFELDLKDDESEEFFKSLEEMRNPGILSLLL